MQEPVLSGLKDKFTKPRMALILDRYLQGVYLHKKESIYRSLAIFHTCVHMDSSFFFLALT